MSAQHEHWSGRVGFLLATIGSAIGLGSIWKFPYEVGANGGGVFVLCYLAGLVLIVLPLFLTELAIGRRGQMDAAASMAAVAVGSGRSPRWALVGVLGIVTASLILSFYSVIGSWALAYGVDAAGGGLAVIDAAGAQSRFAALLASPGRIGLYHSLFMLMTGLIVAKGVAGGLERASKVLMPILMALITVLAAYSLIEGDAVKTLHFLFAVDVSRLTPAIVLDALGLGFFSIGVGLAVMITYAAYANANINLTETAIVTILGDTAISFLAGFAVFPVVFAENLDPSGGPGLVFVTLPLAFAHMPAGGIAGFAFFVLLVIAALCSAISMLEMPVAWLCRTKGWSRPSATLGAGLACWAAGFATVLSFNLWKAWHPLGFLGTFGTATVFDLLDYLTSNVLLPLGGVLLAVFAGWVIPTRVIARELELGPKAAALVGSALRFVVPVGIGAVTFAHLFG